MQRIKRVSIIASFVVISVLLITGCGSRDRYADLRSYIEQLKVAASKKQQKDVVPVVKQLTPVIYGAATVRSPFEDAESIAAKNTASGAPLQIYPLSVLRFVGTVSQDHVISAFVMTPDNMIYSVKVGDMIGDHRGKITSIQEDGVNVTEEYTENGRDNVQRIVTLQLKDAH